MAHATAIQQPADANPVMGQDQGFSPRLENVPTSRVLTAPVTATIESSKVTRRESPAFSANRRQKTATDIATRSAAGRQCRPNK